MEGHRRQAQAERWSARLPALIERQLRSECCDVAKPGRAGARGPQDTVRDRPVQQSNATGAASEDPGGVALSSCAMATRLSSSKRSAASGNAYCQHAVEIDVRFRLPHVAAGD